jgi:nucleoside-diphosphate-sugar epimerase
MIPPAADHDPEMAWEVNVGGTGNLLAAMKGQHPVPRLIYASSISVYGDRLADPGIRRGDPLRPSVGDEYAKTKIAAERMIRSAHPEWTILRLCGILTSELKIQPLMFHMPLDTCLEWCHSADAGYALVEAIQHDELDGRVFNLGGGESCRTKAADFLRTMLPLYGLDPSVLPAYAFARHNFHSGYYLDGDELDELLGFRRKTLQDYFNFVKHKVPAWQRLLVSLVPDRWVGWYLTRMSEPLQAIRANDAAKIERFYGSRQVFEQLHKASA